MSGTLVSYAGNSIRFSPENCLSQTQSARSHRRTLRFRAGALSLKASAQTLPATDVAVESLRRRPASLYDVLNVKETASVREIKTAYRRLAKVYHPDASESDGTDFMEIHKAYATLSDPTARALYDLSLGVRRRRVYAAVLGRSGRVYSTRSWETDQCW